MGKSLRRLRVRNFGEAIKATNQKSDGMLGLLASHPRLVRQVLRLKDAKDAKDRSLLPRFDGPI